MGCTAEADTVPRGEHFDGGATSCANGAACEVSRLMDERDEAVDDAVEDDQGNEVDEATWLQERLGSDAVGKADAGLIMWSAARMSLGVAAMS